MLQGLTSGSVASIVASLVSLPLHSPNDAFFSTVTVMIASLLVGLAAGAVWTFLASRPNPRHRFALVWAVAFAVSVLVMAALNTQLDRMLSFGVPLSAIVFALTGALTVVAARFRPLRSWLTASIGLAAALAIGIGLAGQGDQESGRLELPPRDTGTIIQMASDEEVT